MKARFIVSGILLLCSCSGSPGVNPLLAEREQEDVFRCYNEGKGLMSGFEERAKDNSEKEELNSFKEDYQRAMEIEKEIWAYIAELEQLKAELAEDLFDGSVDRNLLNSSGGERALISKYNLRVCNTEVATTSFSYESPNGKKLQRLFKDVRKMITEKLAHTANRRGRADYFFRDKGITDFNDQKELRGKVMELIVASNVAKDDQEMLISIYTKLSINKAEWKQLLPEESNCLELFQLIGHLEKEMLHARTLTYQLMQSRYCIADFGFDSMLSVVSGKNVASAGDTIEIAVNIAGFNSYKQPIVSCDNAKVTKITSENGTGKVYVVVPSEKGETVTFHGEITLKNKSGVPKTVHWQKEVFVK